MMSLNFNNPGENLANLNKSMALPQSQGLEVTT
jgi:hypothetical protein